MCGIVGYLGKRDAVPILMEGLQRLEYRGYDSAGIAIAKPDGVRCQKAAGKIRELEAVLPKRLKGSPGIAHTRWATHGEPSNENAHPHVDASGQIALIHNGIVENASALRARLEAEGVEFRSDTDSEVLVHLIATAGADDLEENVRRALSAVEGTYGIAVIDARQPDRLLVARNGSAVVLGIGEREMFAASDVAAIVRHTRQVVHLDDRELAVLTAEGFRTSTLEATPTTKTPSTISYGDDEYEKGGYAHFMHKEIHEQPESMARTLQGRLDERFATAHLGGLELSARDLLDIRRIKVLGCGSAYYAGLVGAHLLETLTRVPADARETSGERRQQQRPCSPAVARRVPVASCVERVRRLESLRGRDESGRPLLLDREYVKHGVRARSRELATQALGYRTEADRVRTRERGIEVQRFGELDAILERRMGPGRLVSFEDPVPASGRAAALRLQLIGRLQYLERLGLASRADAKTWRLALDHQPALREMQLLGDVQKSLGRGDLGITDPSASREVVRLEPGMRVRGRVAGTAANELGEAPFLVLEATDGRVLLVPETPAMEARRGEGGLRRGHVVTLLEHESVQGGRRVRWTEVQEHGRLRDLVRTRELATVLDLEALGRSRPAPRTEPPAAPRGFARAWARAVEGRRERLAAVGLLVRVGPESDRGAGTSWVAVPRAEPQVALQTKQRDRSSLSFSEAEALAGREIEHANASNHQHDGQLVAWAHDEHGQRFLVLDVGWKLVAIPNQRRDLEIGSRVSATLERMPAERSRESQLGWQITDRERERDRGRSR